MLYKGMCFRKRGMEMVVRFHGGWMGRIEPWRSEEEVMVS
jgi:hypothetical protein